MKERGKWLESQFGTKAKKYTCFIIIVPISCAEYLTIEMGDVLFSFLKLLCNVYYIPPVISVLEDF